MRFRAGAGLHQAGRRNRKHIKVLLGGQTRQILFGEHDEAGPRTELVQRTQNDPEQQDKKDGQKSPS